MTNEKNSAWAQIPIAASTLKAIVSGVAAVVFSVYGIQLWVDSRVDAALDYRVSPLEREMERYQALSASDRARIRELERRVDRNLLTRGIDGNH